MTTNRKPIAFTAAQIATATFCAALACASSAPAAEYSFTDLGQIMDEISSTTDINNYGQVTGYYDIPGPDPFEATVFLWTPNSPNDSMGSRIDLGSINAIAPMAINDYGQVMVGDLLSELRLWTPATPNGTTGNSIDLETLLGLSDVLPTNINNYGQLVGVYNVLGPGGYFLWTPTTPNGTSGSSVDLEPLDGFASSFPLAINASGQVVGQLAGVDEFDPSPAFLWTPTTPNSDSGTMINLGTLVGHTQAQAHDINASGQVIGGSYNGLFEDEHAFLWTPTTPNGSTDTMIDLGPGLARGINAHGHVVGNAAVPFLYTSQTGMVDLTTLVDLPAGWRLAEVTAINDFGQIVGIAEFVDPNFSVFHAYLLTPVDLLPGDYNQNGTVDAADYVVWRKTGINGPEGYTIWRTHFGQSAPGSGAGSSAPGSAGGSPSAVPEPATCWLALMGVAATMAARRTHSKPTSGEHS